MASNEYANWEKQYKFFSKQAHDCSSNDLINKIVAKDMGKPLPKDPEHDEYIYDQVYLYNGIAIQFLTKMCVYNPDSFEYYTEMNKKINWFMDRTQTRASKGYDQYIISQIILGSEYSYFWEKEFKKNYKFLFRKIHNIKNIMYWVIRFNTIAINDGFYSLANFIISSAIDVLEYEDSFSSEMRSYLEDKYIEK